MKLIVAAIDFSPVASAAMHRAAQLAALFGARLALLHVARKRSAWERRGDAVQPFAALHREAARIRAEYRIPVDAHLARGAAYKEIAAFAEAAGADLVVIGLRGGLLQDLLGSSTAQRVRHRLAVPLLAVTREPGGPYRRILVATDLSPASARSAHLAFRMFPRASIRLLHVCPPVLEGRLAMGGMSESAREEYRSRTALQATSELRRFVKRSGLGRALFEVRVGPAAAKFRERAKQLEVDLVVMAASDKSWLEKLILFGFTDAMLSDGERDVLIMPSAWTFRPLSLPQTHLRNLKWESTAEDYRSASRALTVG